MSNDDEDEDNANFRTSGSLLSGKYYIYIEEGNLDEASEDEESKYELKIEVEQN